MVGCNNHYTIFLFKCKHEKIAISFNVTNSFHKNTCNSHFQSSRESYVIFSGKVTLFKYNQRDWPEQTRGSSESPNFTVWKTLLYAIAPIQRIRNDTFIRWNFENFIWRGNDTDKVTLRVNFRNGAARTCVCSLLFVCTNSFLFFVYFFFFSFVRLGFIGTYSGRRYAMGKR